MRGVQHIFFRIRTIIDRRYEPDQYRPPLSASPPPRLSAALAFNQIFPYYTNVYVPPSPPPPMTVRAFIALYPDPAAREEMARFTGCLRARERGVRWEQAEKIHVTVKFLGDTETRVLDAMAEALRDAVGAMRAGDELPDTGIEGVVDSVGGFPNQRRPRIVWLGFSRAPEAVLLLQRVVEDVCEGHGAERERKAFTPHFTIGRVRQGGDTAGLEKALQACSFQPSPVRFTRLCIMESTLAPSGAIHKERFSIPLTPGE